MKIFGSRSSSDKIGLAGLLLFLLAAVAPIVWCIGYALTYSVGWAGYLRHGFTLHFWIKALTEGEVGRSFFFSVWVATAVVCLGAAVALVIVLLFREPLRRGPLALLIQAPLALSGLVSAFIISRWLSGAGVFSRVGHLLGLVQSPSKFPSLVNDQFGLGIIAAHLLVAVPFLTLALLQVHEVENVEPLRQLAATLGASRAQSRWRIALPILLRKSAANLLLYFLFVLGSYEIPLIVGAQNPTMISLLTRRKFGIYELAQKPEAFVIAVIYTGLLLAILVVLLRKTEPQIL